MNPSPSLDEAPQPWLILGMRVVYLDAKDDRSGNLVVLSSKVPRDLFLCSYVSSFLFCGSACVELRVLGVRKNYSFLQVIQHTTTTLSEYNADQIEFGRRFS